LAGLGSLYFWELGLRAFIAPIKERERAEAESGEQIDLDLHAFDAGREHFSQAAEYYREAVGAFDAAIDLDGDSTALYLGKARAMRGVAQSIVHATQDWASRESFLREAVSAYDEAVQRDPTNVDLLIECGVHLAELATSSARRTLHERAVEMIDRALTLDPEHTRGLGLLTDALHRLADSQGPDDAFQTYERLLQVYDRLLQIDPGSRFWIPAKANGYLSLAKFQEQNELLHLALESCNAALAVLDEAAHPSDPPGAIDEIEHSMKGEALSRMADLLVRTGRPNEAIEAYRASIDAMEDSREAGSRRQEAVLRHNPGGHRARGTVLMRLAELLTASGRTEEARSALEEARDDLSRAHRSVGGERAIQLMIEHVDRILAAT
jgi:tetratricopeptide (TPR) repeat protein